MAVTVRTVPKLRATLVINSGNGGFGSEDSVYSLSVTGNTVLQLLVAVESYTEAVRAIETARQYE